MKWVALTAFILLIPLLANWLRTNPSHAPKVWTVFGFLPLVMGSVHGAVAPISWPHWAGYVKGFEFSVVDAIAIAILISRPNARHSLPLAGLWVVYFLTTLISMVGADIPQAAFFVAWQILRVAIIAWAAASVCTNDQGAKSLLLGMCIGMIANAAFAIEQRLTGSIQTDGLYSHQNLLGMVSHFVAFPALSLFLSGNRQKLVLAGVGAAIIVAIFGASRATIGLAAVGYGLLFALSLARKPTRKKMGVIAAGLLVLGIASPFALSSLNDRFEAQGDFHDTEYDERVIFEATARQMLTENPMGVGANHYVLVSNTRGYADDNGVAAVFGSRSAHVHNAYLLVGAETGYIGLLAFVSLLLTPILLALRTAWRYRRDTRGEILLGFATTLIVIVVHCFYEWVFVAYDVQMLFGIAVGSIVGLSRRMTWTHRFPVRGRARVERNSDRQVLA